MRPPRDPYDGSLDPFQRTMLGTPSTTTPEDCYVNAIAPTEEPMGHLNESTTNLDVQGPILRPEKYDTRFGDTNTLGIEEENVDFERWKTRSGVSAIVNSPQYDSKYNLRFPRTTNNQAKISSSTKTAFPIYDFDYAIAYPHIVHEFQNATPSFPYSQSLAEDNTNVGCRSIHQQIHRPSQYGFEERSYGQFGFRSSSRLQKPQNNSAPTGLTIPQDAVSTFLSLEPLRSAQPPLLPDSKGARVPGTNLLRLSHACFLGTIPLPDMAFHAPGVAISAKTEEVLRRPVPEYKAVATSVVDVSMSSGDNPRSGHDLFDEVSSPI